jgi:hypothetical protein
MTSFNHPGKAFENMIDDQRWNVLRGLYRDGLVKSGCGEDDYYIYRGNPLTETDCYVADPNNPTTPRDQRIQPNIGPFNLKAGSSQEIWYSVIGASVYASQNRLDAIRRLFDTHDKAQALFDNNLLTPLPPQKPSFTLSALDGKVALQWNDASEHSEDLFGELSGIRIDSGYSADYLKNDFQGYRVYKSLTGLPGDFALLAEYDKPDGITTVANRKLDTYDHLTIESVVVGTDQGLRYAYVDEEVTNGRLYYYAVTSYDAQPYIAWERTKLDVGNIDNDPQNDTIAQPAGIPISLESSIPGNAQSVVPMRVMSNYSNASTAVTHTTGSSEALIEAHVVNPSALSGDDYQLEFYRDSIGLGLPVAGLAPGTLFFRVINLSTGEPATNSTRTQDDPSTFVDINRNGVFDSGTDQLFHENSFSTGIATIGSTGSDELFYVWDGMWIKVFNQPLAFKSITITQGSQYTGVVSNSNTSNFFAPINFGLTGMGGGAELGFFGDPIYPSRMWDTELRFSRSPSGWQRAYLHTGFTENNNRVARVPFTAWEVDSLDGSSAPRQIQVMVRDQRVINGWFLNSGHTDDGTGRPQFRNYVYPVDANYAPSDGSLIGQSTLTAPIMFTLAGWGVRNIDLGATTPGDQNPPTGDGKSWNDYCRRFIDPASASGAVIDSAEYDSAYSQVPDECTITVKAYHVLTTNDRYSISTTALAKLSKPGKKAIKNVKVVPNPYYRISNAQHFLAQDQLLRFVNLPDACTIRIFTVAGDLVRIIHHNAASNNNRVDDNPYDEAKGPSAYTSTETWDVKNKRGRQVASGIYIAHIESKAGSTTVKFAVIQ